MGIFPFFFGGAGGIRTHVANKRQTDFESAPLWPLRYRSEISIIISKRSTFGKFVFPIFIKFSLSCQDICYTLRNILIQLHSTPFFRHRKYNPVLRYHFGPWQYHYFWWSRKYYFFYNDFPSEILCSFVLFVDLIYYCITVFYFYKIRLFF